MHSNPVLYSCASEAGESVKTVPDLLEERRQEHLDDFTATESFKGRTYAAERQVPALMEQRQADDRLRLASQCELPAEQEAEQRERTTAIREVQTREATHAAEQEGLDDLREKVKPGRCFGDIVQKLPELDLVFFEISPQKRAPGEGSKRERGRERA